MNIVVLAVQACPVAALGPYGNEWIATPHLDRLAAAGVVFDHHISDCPTFAAARRAWVSGQRQTPRRAEPNSNATGATESVLARLNQAGVRTLLVDATRHGVPPEYYAGVAEKFACPPQPTDPTPTTALLNAIPAVVAALAGSRGVIWIEMDRLVPPWDVPQDVFDAYIEDVFDTTPDDPAARESTLDANEVLTAEDPDQVIDPTAEEYTEEVEVEPETEPDVAPAAESNVRPWTEPPVGWFDRSDLASWELLHRSFAAAVTTFDAGLGKLFAALESAGLGGFAIVFTADRGQPLGEHGIVGEFRPWLHSEWVQVPLIVRLPETEAAGQRVHGLTMPADLMPTILGLAGVPVPEGLDGVSLVPQLQGVVTTARNFVVSGCVREAASEWAIRTLDWAYLEPGEAAGPDEEPRTEQLFRKPDDRFEVNNIAGVNQELEAELAAMLANQVGGKPPSAPALKNRADGGNARG